jgi:serine/threonine protein kinase
MMVDDHYNLRLIDFGMSNTLADLLDPNFDKINRGSPMYKAPEISSDERVQDGTKSDVFSLGCILFTMYFNQYTWANSNIAPFPEERLY